MPPRVPPNSPPDDGAVVAAFSVLFVSPRRPNNPLGLLWLLLLLFALFKLPNRPPPAAGAFDVPDAFDWAPVFEVLAPPNRPGLVAGCCPRLGKRLEPDDGAGVLLCALFVLPPQIEQTSACSRLVLPKVEHAGYFSVSQFLTISQCDLYLTCSTSTKEQTKNPLSTTRCT